MPVSLKDIAAKVGVSDTTISMALRDHPRISRSRRAEIQRIARQMGYVPNPLAQGLRGRQTKSVGLLWSLDGSPGNAALFRDLTCRIHELGYVCYVMDHLSEPVRVAALLDTLVQRRVDAVVVQIHGRLHKHPEVRRQLERFPASLLVCNEPTEDLPFDQVIHDRSHAYWEIANHLQATGRRRPRMLIGRRMDVAGSTEVIKRNAFIEALTAVGLPADDEIDLHFRKGPRPRAKDYWQSLEAIRKPVPFDALVCGTDEGAVVACAWLRRHGYRVPDDVAVIGFNNSRDDLDYLDPPLASIQRNDSQLAATIEAMLSSRLKMPGKPRETRTVKMSFVWRASAGGDGCKKATSESSGSTAHEAHKETEHV